MRAPSVAVTFSTGFSLIPRVAGFMRYNAIVTVLLERKKEKNLVFIFGGTRARAAKVPRGRVD